MLREACNVINRWIEWCARNPFLVFTGTLLLVLASVWSMQHIPLDALPDISDVEVIIYTPWAGEPPNIIEDQVTYPIVTTMLAAPQSRARPNNVRGFLYLRCLPRWNRPLLGALASTRILAGNSGRVAAGCPSGDRT